LAIATAEKGIARAWTNVMVGQSCTVRIPSIKPIKEPNIDPVSPTKPRTGKCNKEREHSWHEHEQSKAVGSNGLKPSQLE